MRGAFRPGLATKVKANALSLAYLVALSRLTDRPLWAIITGSTGSGKSKLASIAADCTPPEDRINATSKTNEALMERAASQPDDLTLLGLERFD